MICRVTDSGAIEKFQDIGVRVVHPSTAMVSLLDHFVRSPLATSLLLYDNKSDQDFIEIEITNPEVNGLALREIALPLDTLILQISRDNTQIISHGYTTLKLGDQVTLVGKQESLHDAIRLLER